MKQICPTLKAEAHGNLPKVVMIGNGGRSQSEVGDIAPTVMAAWYCKSTWTSRSTLYVVINDKDKTSD